MSAGSIRRDTVIEWLHSICLPLAGVFVLTVVFEGVLRWAFAVAHVPQLIYLRDGIPVLLIVAGSVIAFLRRDTSWLIGMACVAAMAGGAALWSVYNGTGIMQAFFALKTLWLLPAGAALWKIVENEKENVRYFVYIAFLCVGAGLLCSSIFTPPWLGTSYQIGDVEIEGQREWTLDSINRIAGFSRASFDAASHLAFLAVLILTSSARAGTKWIYTILAIGGIAATTSRSVAIGFLVAAGAYVATAVLRGSRLRWILFPVPLLPVLIYFVATEMPWALNFVAAADQGGIGSTNSFLTRSEDIWLEAVAKLQGAEAWLLGLGLGNIGAAQKAFSPADYNPGDNLFVYCVVAFGIAGCLVIFGLLLRVWVEALAGRQSARYGLMIALLSGAGMTISALETPLIALGTGLALGEFLSRWRLPVKRRRRAFRNLPGTEPALAITPHHATENGH